jgi:hypothetical protein
MKHTVCNAAGQPVRLTVRRNRASRMLDLLATSR